MNVWCFIPAVLWVDLSVESLWVQTQPYTRVVLGGNSANHHVHHVQIQLVAAVNHPFIHNSDQNKKLWSNKQLVLEQATKQIHL